MLVLLATATVTADSLGHRSEKDAEKRDRGRISGSRRVGERPTRRPTYRLSWGRGRERERERKRDSVGRRGERAVARRPTVWAVAAEEEAAATAAAGVSGRAAGSLGLRTLASAR